MHPVSKNEFMEIIHRLLRIDDRVLNFYYIQSNMNVLKYFINFDGIEYLFVDDYTYKRYQVLNKNINESEFKNYIYGHLQALNFMEIWRFMENDNRFNTYENYCYRYTIINFNKFKGSTQSGISVYYNTKLFEYDKYLTDYYNEHPEQKEDYLC
jgi:hypothetical protein